MKLRKLAVVCALAAAWSVAGTASADTLRIAFLDPLSGPFAPVGQNGLRSYQHIADLANSEKWAGNHTIEVVGFDNKGSPQESLIVLKSIIDQGYRYVTQGNGSGVGLALIDAINKHNERNPGKELVYLNYAAVDPDMTNSKCSFWHFRFDANSDMKMEALTSILEKDGNVKKVYIIGQNYAFGHQVSKAAKEYLKRKRPDIEIVGDDLHPIGQVRDFAPYIAKIKASGADTVITGNWGTDLALLIKAAKDADLQANFYTYYAGTMGVPTAMGAAGEGRVKMVTYWNANGPAATGQNILETFKKKYNEDYYMMATHTAVLMLSNAVKTTNSVDPTKVAIALAGMKVNGLNGAVEMRASDHQLQQPLYITTWTKANGKDVKYDQENTGFGWKTDAKLEARAAMQDTSCSMKRPL